MGTDVTYNGVKLKNVVTRSWEQEPVYDASGTDLLFFRHRMRFEGIVHAQGDWDDVAAGIAFEGGYEGAENAVEMHNLIYNRLGRPRGHLTVEVEWPKAAGGAAVSETLYEATGSGGGAAFDVDNGPKTRDLAIIAIASNKVFKVAFSIECATVDCEGSSAVPPSVLNNRWSVGETMDENFFVTRTIRGKLRFSQTVASMEDDFKRYVVPKLEAGFRRERVEFAVAENGVEADYQVVDRQTTTAPPWPASRVSGTYTESCGEQGIEWFSDVQVRLDGHPGVNRQLLITRAVQIMDARLKFLAEAQKNGEKKAIILEGAQLTEHLGDANAVELHVRLRRTLQDVDQHTWLGQLRTQTMGRPLEITDSVTGEPEAYDPTHSFVPALRGYDSHGGANAARTGAQYFLLQCFLQQPCSGSDEHKIYGATGGQGTGVPSTVGTVREVASIEQPNDLTTELSDDAKKTVYTLGVAESVYHVHHMRVQLPLAGDGSDPNADTSFIAVLSGGQCQREIRYEAEKVGEIPEIPKPVSTYTRDGLRGTLLDHRIRFHPPTLLSGGKDIIFRVHAYYLYAMNRPPTESDVLASLKLPTQTFEKTKYPMNLSVAYNEELGP